MRLHFGYAKVRYRGLAKNTQRIALLLGFTNLLVAGRHRLKSSLTGSLTRVLQGASKAPGTGVGEPDRSRATKTGQIHLLSTATGCGSSSTSDWIVLSGQSYRPREARSCRHR